MDFRAETSATMPWEIPAYAPEIVAQRGTASTALAGVICLVNFERNETRNEDGQDSGAWITVLLVPPGEEGLRKDLYLAGPA